MSFSAEDLNASYIKAPEYHSSESSSKLKTIREYLKCHAETSRDNEAVVFASPSSRGSRQAVTWGELYDKSVRVAKSLITLGLKRDEVVALNIRPCPEWLYLAFGSIFAGAKVVGLSFTYTDGSDLVALMQRLQTCSVLALDPGLDGQNWEILKKLIDGYTRNGEVTSTKMPCLRCLIGHEFGMVQDNLKPLKELIWSDAPDVQLPEATLDDIAMLFQTSGSTGIPKLVAHTHRSLAHVMVKMRFRMCEPRYIAYNDRPFNWIGGCPLQLLSGQKRVTISGFGTPAEDKLLRMIEIIVEEGCTLMIALPPTVVALIQNKHRLPSDWPLEVLVTGGQPTTKNLAKAIGPVCKELGCVYAATEVLVIARCSFTDSEKFHEYSCGTVIPGSGTEVKVVDKDGATLPINMRGELYVRQPSLFKEYFNDAKKTVDARTADGWYRTDDMGRINREGELFVDGRKSNTIISGGMNVVPEMIETVIKSCHGVEAAIVVPVPDPVYHQVLCACVVTTAGSDVTENDIRQHCETVHNDKPGLFTILPKFYLFLDKFPQTYTGKYSRKELENVAKLKFMEKNGN